MSDLAEITGQSRLVVNKKVYFSSVGTFFRRRVPLSGADLGGSKRKAEPL
jgi:hypothetical protein